MKRKTIYMQSTRPKKIKRFDNAYHMEKGRIGELKGVSFISPKKLLQQGRDKPRKLL